jgi:hypothetical protein
MEGLFVNNSKEEEQPGIKKKRISVVEILVIVAIFGILAAILLPALAEPRYSITPPTCFKFMRQLGLAMELYSAENAGRLPPIDGTKNNFIFESNLLHPEYLMDPMLAHCPQHPDFDPTGNFRLSSGHPIDGTPKGHEHPDCITDISYIYLGWAVTNDDEAEAFFKAYNKLSPESYDKIIILPEGKDDDGAKEIRRLEASAAQAQIPVIWDRPYTNPKFFGHQYGDVSGGNVLYLDGHMDYIGYGEKFPMTETMARLLEERPREPIAHCEE